MGKKSLMQNRYKLRVYKKRANTLPKGESKEPPTEAEEAREGQTGCEAERECRLHRIVDVPNLNLGLFGSARKERGLAWQRQ